MVFRRIHKWRQTFRLRRFLTQAELKDLEARLDELTEGEAFEWLFFPSRALQRVATENPNALVLLKNTLARVAKEKAAKGAQ